MNRLFLFLLIYVGIVGCSDFIEQTKSRDDIFIEMRDSCKYLIVVNNKDMSYVKSYELLSNGAAKVIYLRTLERGHMFDTLIVSGTYGITIRR